MNVCFQEGIPQYRTMNWQTWKQSVKVDLVSPTVQGMHDLGPSSTRNLTLRNLALGINLYVIVMKTSEFINW